MVNATRSHKREMEEQWQKHMEKIRAEAPQEEPGPLPEQELHPLLAGTIFSNIKAEEAVPPFVIPADEDPYRFFNVMTREERTVALSRGIQLERRKLEEAETKLQRAKEEKDRELKKEEEEDKLQKEKRQAEIVIRQSEMDALNAAREEERKRTFAQKRAWMDERNAKARMRRRERKLQIQRHRHRDTPIPSQGGTLRVETPFGPGVIRLEAQPIDVSSSEETTSNNIPYPAKPADPEPILPDGSPNACVICFERAVTTACSCGHTYSCITCVLEYKPTTCAICKAALKFVIQLYLQ